jgi:predicted dehydrogenase
MLQISVLVIGCGSIGERHLRCFQQTGRANVMVCDTNTSLLRQIGGKYRVPTFHSWKQALAERPGAVVICTPAPSHVPIALAALRAGCHVLIEKPLSNSLAGIDALLEACRDSAQQSAVAYIYHSYPVLDAARAWLRNNDLGPIQQVTVVTGQPFHRLRPGYAATYYRDRQSGGGAIQDALTHPVNWVESVIGRADSVLCDCAHLVVPGVEVEDTVHVSARHGPTLASYALNQFQVPNETTFQFNAKRGSVRIEFPPHRWGFFREGDAAWTWHDSPPLDRDAPFITQANAFMDQIEGQPTRLCSVPAAADTLRFNLAAIASAEADTRIECRALHA